MDTAYNTCCSNIPLVHQTFGPIKKVSIGSLQSFFRVNMLQWLKSHRPFLQLRKSLTGSQQSGFRHTHKKKQFLLWFSIKTSSLRCTFLLRSGRMQTSINKRPRRFRLICCVWLRDTQASSPNVIVTDKSLRGYKTSILLVHSGGGDADPPLDQRKGQPLWLRAHCQLKSHYSPHPLSLNLIFSFPSKQTITRFDIQRIHRIHATKL